MFVSYSIKHSWSFQTVSALLSLHLTLAQCKTLSFLHYSHWVFFFTYLYCIFYFVNSLLIALTLFYFHRICFSSTRTNGCVLVGWNYHCKQRRPQQGQIFLLFLNSFLPVSHTDMSHINVLELKDHFLARSCVKKLFQNTDVYILDHKTPL